MQKSTRLWVALATSGFLAMAPALASAQGAGAGGGTGSTSGGASTPPQRLYGVETLEFGAGLVRGKAPMDGGFGIVALVFPDRNLLLHAVPTR